MPWTIPDKGEGEHDLQSILFQEYLDVLVAGLDGRDCVLSGCAVTGGADMTPAVAKGAVIADYTLFPVPAGDVTIGAADATYPRFDLIVVTNAGAKAVRAGTPAVSPKPPARSANDVVLAVVYVPAGSTSVPSSRIVDLRLTRTVGPITLHVTYVPEVTNNTAAVIEMLKKASAGLTIPSGLFSPGATLRVRIHGNVLINSGGPTLNLAIVFGGTTMFADTSAAAVADADRRAFLLQFDVTAQTMIQQALTGTLAINDFSTGIAPPATGIGDAWPAAATQEATPTFGGTAAVNIDGADQVLSVRWTFSVANAANELVVQGATVELV